VHPGAQIHGVFFLPALVFKTYSDGEYHYAFGEVYAPLQIDSDGEAMTAEEIQKLAHEFIARGLVDAIDLEHSKKASGVVVVEFFIARPGDPDYSEGAWVLGVRIQDDEIWEKIQAGEINGFSFNATMDKTKVRVPVDAQQIYSGETFASSVDKETAGIGIPGHTHKFYVELDAAGHVLFGATDVVFTHKHIITRTITTNSELRHKHRFVCR
jgi:hypothetical protein